MHEPHSSGVRRITHFVRVEVVMISVFTTVKSLNKAFTYLRSHIDFQNCAVSNIKNTIESARLDGCPFD